jgi:hypothetical protein
LRVTGMSSIHDEMARKVLEIFSLLPGAALQRIDPRRGFDHVFLDRALVPEFGSKRATEIAFHLTDWGFEAAFLVAVALFPERFTPEEIAAGAVGMLIHVPGHTAAAAKLAEYPVSELS